MFAKYFVLFFVGLILFINNFQIECSPTHGFVPHLNHSYLLEIKKHVEDPKVQILSLKERIEIEKSTFHWYPYQRINYFVTADGEVKEEECIPRDNSIDEFPQDIFSQEARIRGAILLHFIGAIYFFIILATIVDHYFLPAVECICEDLNISENVAATTFMATATSMPEFFTNTISIFLAKSDMGLGTIIGSMLFNTLGVGAAASLAAPKHLHMDWWPVTRDSIVNAWNLAALVAIAWDGRVEWYETIVFMVLYVFYFVVMFQNPRIMKFVKGIVEERWNWCTTVRKRGVSEGVKRMSRVFEREEIERRASQLSRRLTILGYDNPVFDHTNPTNNKSSRLPSISEKVDSGSIRHSNTSKLPIEVLGNFPAAATQSSFEDEKEEYSLWHIPKDASKLAIFWYFFTWPIRFILHYIIPDPLVYRKWYPLTFIVCMLTIAGCAYFIFWMIVIIGYTFGIPEAIMGLTFLAAGGCLPEAASAVLVARTGSGGVGVSNALGANSLNILFSLGFPWFIRTMIDGAGSTGAYIHIYSYGIEFIITSLLLAILCLYIVLAIAKYTLRKTVGIVLLVIYAIFVTFAILMELDIFFDSGRCPVF